MKRILATILAVALLTLSVAAAEPAFEMNGNTVWLGADNHLFLTDTTGVVKELPSYIADIIGMDETNIYCTTNSGKLYAVRVDGSASTQISAEPTEEQLNQYRNNSPYLLAEGSLIIPVNESENTTISNDVVVFAANESELWFVRKELTGSYSLNVMEIAAETETLAPVICSMAVVNEPVSMTLTRDAVTLVDAQHTVLVFLIEDSSIQSYPATSELTAAASYINGKLFRYAKEDNGWRTESVEAAEATRQAAISTPSSAATTPVPTSTARTVVTPTPTPTAKPRTVTPSPTPEEDETIRKWDKGSRVKKMQQRLADLGYPVGKIDGSYGEQTAIAVNLFQNSAGLAEHTYMTKKAQNKLYASNAPRYDQYVDLKKGDKGIRVRLMQEALKAKGFDPGKIDGIYGKNTIAAVAAYQRFLNMQLEQGEVPGEKASRWLLMNLYDEITPPPTDPVNTDPVNTDPVNTDPVNTDPVNTDPVNTDPVNTDPVNTDPVNTDPVNTEPVNTEPVFTDPVNTDPVNTDPVNSDPVNTDPVNTDPVNTDPVNTDPVNTDPVNTDPVNTNPVNTDPVNTDPVNTDSGNTDPNPDPNSND